MPKKCYECGGKIILSLYKLTNVMVPTCKKCGEQWVDDTLALEIDRFNATKRIADKAWEEYFDNEKKYIKKKG